MSFTVEVKEELCGEELSHKQEKIFLYGFFYCLKSSEYFTESEIVKNYIKNILGTKTVVTAVSRRGRDGFLFDLESFSSKYRNSQLDTKYLDGRDESTGLFLRGAFLACGVVTDPNKSYHLEFSVGEEKKSRELFKIISESGMNVKISCRKDKYILYSKESESISDILTYIGAMINSMEVMNAKIYKDVRNNVNRAVNCETANIDKIVNASRKQIEDIELIEKTKGLGVLSEELRVIAKLRRENPEASLNDIGRLASPEISRSGVYHRLKRIGEIADKLRGADNEAK